MEIDSVRLWILQHRLNPMWDESHGTRKLSSNKARREKLDVKQATYASWLRTKVPDLSHSQLEKLAIATAKIADIDESRLIALLAPDADIDEFWQLFSSDRQRLDYIRDDFQVWRDGATISHLTYESLADAQGLFMKIRGLVALERDTDELTKRVFLLVKSVHTLSKDRHVIYVEMFVPYAQGNPFKYAGYVGEFGAHKKLYWILSAMMVRSRDMNLMISDTVIHQTGLWKITGKGLTVSEKSTQDIISYEFSLRHLTSETSFRLVEDYDHIQAEFGSPGTTMN